MLGIDFLRNGRLSGLEFMDFQSNNFEKEMVAAIEPHITTKDGEAVLQGTVVDDILPIIEKYTGFNNVSVEMMQEANFMVDVGYLSPNNILNIKNIENWYDVTETTLSKWYAKNKDKVFKGSIDYTKGKVSGAYAELPIKLYLGKPVGSIFTRKEVKELGVSISTMTAGCIAHEMGHCFGACSVIDTSADDNFVIRAALGALGATNEKEKRVVIIRNVANLLKTEIEVKDNIAGIAESEKSEETLIYFNALISRRNTRRALSLGVNEMSSEVIADMYAIRMGFDRGIVATLKIFAKSRVLNIAQTTGIMVLFTSLLIVQIGLVAPLFYLFLMAGLTVANFIFVYGVMSYSGDYNSPFRRFEDAVRQIIAKIKEVDMPSKDRMELVDRASAMLKEIDKLKPIISGTIFDRFLGRVINGSDFKYQEFEHFTQAIANNEMVLLNAKLTTLTA